MTDTKRDEGLLTDVDLQILGCNLQLVHRGARPAAWLLPWPGYLERFPDLSHAPLDGMWVYFRRDSPYGLEIMKALTRPDDISSRRIGKMLGYFQPYTPDLRPNDWRAEKSPPNRPAAKDSKADELSHNPSDDETPTSTPTSADARMSDSASMSDVSDVSDVSDDDEVCDCCRSRSAASPKEEVPDERGLMNPTWMFVKWLVARDGRVEACKRTGVLPLAYVLYTERILRDDSLDWKQVEAQRKKFQDALGNGVTVSYQIHHHYVLPAA